MSPRLQAHRRRQLAAIAGRKITAAAVELAAKRGIPHEKAVMAIFADKELLRMCHQVKGVPVPDIPKSTVDAQNRT